MKASIASVIGAAMTLASTLSITEVAAGPLTSPPQPTAQAAMTCPAGTRPEAAGYVRGGRWRDAHCVSNQAPHY